MKFDEKYKFGACPPFSDYRRLVTHLDGQTFNCVKCGEKTSWVCFPTMTATCSDECLAAQVVQGKPQGPAGHWLTAKDDTNGHPSGDHQSLPGSLPVG